MTNNVLHPTKDDFDTILQENQFVLVDFWATWCTPCKMLAPVIDQLADKYVGSVKVLKVDIDDQSSLAEQYNVQSIPTVILFKNGQIVERDVGAKPLSNYVDMIEKNI